MLHLTKLAKLENGQPPPALGAFQAEHIQLLVSIAMDPLKWMPNPGGRLQADGSRTPSTLFINGQAAMVSTTGSCTHSTRPRSQLDLQGCF